MHLSTMTEKLHRSVTMVLGLMASSTRALIHCRQPAHLATMLYRARPVDPDTYQPNRRNLLGGVIATCGLCSMSTAPVLATSADVEAPPSIAACPKSADALPCLSTATQRLDQTMAPWPFTGTAVETQARIKGALQSSKCAIEEQSTNYLKFKCDRSFAVDELDFVVNEDDSVVTYSSIQMEGPAFGSRQAQLDRLDEIRRRSGLANTSDNYDRAGREGAAGQLKAFWGLQSGAGFEDIVLED